MVGDLFGVRFVLGDVVFGETAGALTFAVGARFLSWVEVHARRDGYRVFGRVTFWGRLAMDGRKR